MIRDPPAMHKPDNVTGTGDLKLALNSGRGSVGNAVQGTATGPRECASCGKVITERFLLKALDVYWHEDCLKCGCCDARLGEVGSTLYTKADLILCKRDYLRLFGVTGNCVACNKVIPAFEMVMRAKSFVYHLECFACQQCNHRFCVGDRFYLCDNKILCEYDYEERLVFANMAHNPSSLAHVRRQVNALQSPNDASRLGAVVPPGAIGTMGSMSQMSSAGGMNSMPGNNGPNTNGPMGINNVPMASNGGPMGLNNGSMGSSNGPMSNNNGPMGMNNGMGYPGSLGADKDMLMGGGGADDASSGYGSPDADTCDTAR